MDERILNNRRAAMEDAFFAKQNDALLRRLRETDEARSRKAALSASSGITDEAVLEKLVSLNIGSDTLAALAMVPLVAVAWADGSVDASERRAAFSRAAAAGPGAGQDVSRQLLGRWLTEPPPPALLAAWKAYIGALSPTLSRDDRGALKAEVLGRARAVAGAAGGFLGMVGTISPDEERVLKELESAFPA